MTPDMSGRGQTAKTIPGGQKKTNRIKRPMEPNVMNLPNPDGQEQTKNFASKRKIFPEGTHNLWDRKTRNIASKFKKREKRLASKGKGKY